MSTSKMRNFPSPLIVCPPPSIVIVPVIGGSGSVKRDVFGEIRYDVVARSRWAKADGGIRIG